MLFSNNASLSTFKDDVYDKLWNYSEEYLIIMLALHYENYYAKQLLFSSESIRCWLHISTANICQVNREWMSFWDGGVEEWSLIIYLLMWLCRYESISIRTKGFSLLELNFNLFYCFVLCVSVCWQVERNK